MNLPAIWIPIFNIVLVYWIGKWAYHTFFLSKAGKKRLMVAKLLHQFQHKRQWDRDKLTEEELVDLDAMIAEAKALRKDKADEKAIDEWMKTSGRRWERLVKTQGSHWPRETVEILIVVIGVVMGIRGLYLQPFKIPTGSMQPSLFGIHFTPKDDAGLPNWGTRVYEGANFSRRYVDAVAQERCQIKAIVPVRRLPVIGFFFPQTALVTTDNVQHILPGAQVNAESAFRKQYAVNHPEIGDWRQFRGPYVYDKGEPIARGHLQLGDHLFVDRVSFQFRDPARGDICVFITDGVRARGHKMSGRYYIKRLVGLPGDTLKIVTRKLYVKRDGDADFRLVDGSDHPAFDRIYSMKGGNRGYTHGHLNLRSNDDEITLKKDEYFMMGDNSENSADSRYWGVVKRNEIVGRAFVVYWPNLRRWGLPDRVKEEQFPSAPNHCGTFCDDPSCLLKEGQGAEIEVQGPKSDAPTTGQGPTFDVIGPE